MLIRGDKLNGNQRRLVLARFVHRHTHENARQTYGGRCPACVQQRQCGGAMMLATADGRVIPWHEYHAPLQTDDEWLAGHAFHFVKDGTRPSEQHRCAEPAYVADAYMAE